MISLVSVNPLEVDGLQSSSVGWVVKRLSQSDNSLNWTWNGTLQQQEIVVDSTVSDETTHWGDGLLGSVELGGSRTFVTGLSNSVNLVVNRGSVVVTSLTSSGNSPLDVGWMPSTNTSNLSGTSVGLSWKLLGTPSVSNTLETVTLGNGNDVDHLVLLKDRVNRDGLLEVLLSPVNLVGNRTTVDLNLSQVSLLLGQWGLSDLGVDKNSHNGTVLGDSSKLLLDLSSVVSVLLGVFGESSLLRLVPVLVESSLDFVRKVLSPDGGQGSKTSWGLDVTNNTDNNKLWSVDDGSSLDDLSLVHLRTWSVQVSDDGGHTSLVTKESSQSNWLRLDILRESLTSTSLLDSSLSWEETQGSVSWFFVLSVRHCISEKLMGRKFLFELVKNLGEKKKEWWCLTG
ncbi:hypothetical protein OGAPHI_005695 [Ogataea philodendri]|uniref:Uncharacterized protein n=1 Tax=Ogataea philodendri TaxID=1378263 RepID=A0A9P8NYW0_9ASCO|nr:uncharacterized protein OGAPHI_005695 [Ogataea philodendri]KAH3662443.1 hypothetical protein OGAPHI_005695 [Ogataea philodendri]